MVLLQFTPVYALEGKLDVYLTDGGEPETPITDFTVKVWHVANISPRTPTANFAGATTIDFTDIVLDVTADNSAIAAALYAYATGTTPVIPDFSENNGPGGTYEFPNLAEGIYLVAAVDEVRARPVYEFKPFIVAIPFSGHFIVDATPKGSSTLGSLRIDKEVVLPEGTGLPGGYNPTFTIEDSEGHLIDTLHYTTAGDFNSTGQSRVIEDLIPGIYTITESNAGVTNHVWTLSVQGGSLVAETTDTATATVVANVLSIVKLTNTYAEETGSLRIQKAFNMPDGVDAPTSLTFTVKNSAGATVGTLNYPADFTAGVSTPITGLPQGNYTVTETGAGVSGYTWILTASGGSASVATDSAQTVTVTVAAGASATTTLQLTNSYTLILGSLRIDKVITFPEGGSLPTGWNPTFEVKNSSGTTIATLGYLTPGDFNSSGQSRVLEDLVPGTYTITESNMGVEDFEWVLEVSGGGKDSFNTASGTVVGGVLAIVQLTNKYTPTPEGTGSLRILKDFSVPSAISAPTSLGFSIKNSSGIEVGTLSYPGDFTDGLSDAITDLPPGTYYITETGAAISGYRWVVTATGGSAIVDANNVVSVVVVADDESSTTVEMTNTYSLILGSLKLVKEVVLPEGVAIPSGYNPTFTISGPDSYSATVSYSQFNSSGEYSISDLVPGAYTIVESGTGIEDYDWALTIIGGTFTPPDTVSTSVVGNTQAIVEFKNTYTPVPEEPGILRIVKTFIPTGLVIPEDYDPTFTITPPDGDPYTISYKDDFVAGEYVETNVAAGVYTVVENHGGTDISGFTFYGVSYTFELAITNEVTVPAGGTGSLTVINEYREIPEEAGHLRIIKAFNPTGITLPSGYNPSFTITRPDETTYTIHYQTDFVGGVYEIENVALGEYTVTENTGDAEIAGYSFTLPAAASNTVADGAWAEITLTNVYTPHRGDLRIEKVISPASIVLPTTYNPTFTITRPDGTTYTISYIDDFVDGVYLEEDVLAGTYTVVENAGGTAIPNFVFSGYAVTGSGVVTLDGTATLVVTNTYTPETQEEPVGYLRIVKVFASGSPSRPAGFNPTFTVTDGEGATVATVSYSSFDSNGGYTIPTPLAEGTYTVRETGAGIVGYTIAVSYTGGGSKSLMDYKCRHFPEFRFTEVNECALKGIVRLIMDNVEGRYKGKDYAEST